MLDLLRDTPEDERPLLVLAPRHPERWDEVARLLEERGVGFVRRSSGMPVGENQVLLLDTLGELARAYSVAEVAFVGGSLVEKGGHNPLEAAALGVPVVMGPHLFNFQEISQILSEAGGLSMCQGADEVVAQIIYLLTHPKEAKAMGERGREVVLQNRGALDRTLQVIAEIAGKEANPPL